jgi:ketosteroid isomerase-like protein
VLLAVAAVATAQGARHSSVFSAPYSSPLLQGQPLPSPLESMVAAERRFAARAAEVGWKNAFLEFFSESSVGFAEGAVGYAKDQIRARPDPPPGHSLRWEPRWGDIAASGELGYLTGPSESRSPGRNAGRPEHSVYTSVWKRERDGTFKVVMDVGVPVPGPAPFAAGFTRAPSDRRFSGDYDERMPPLAAADRVLNSDLRTGQVRAYRGRLAPSARLHRPGRLPDVGEARILAFLKTQPPVVAADSRFAESSHAGDLGYTWGTYMVRRAGRGRGNRMEEGFYVRLWVRERGGQWRVALDVLHPQ